MVHNYIQKINTVCVYTNATEMLPNHIPKMYSFKVYANGTYVINTMYITSINFIYIYIDIYTHRHIDISILYYVIKPSMTRITTAPRALLKCPKFVKHDHKSVLLCGRSWSAQNYSDVTQCLSESGDQEL